MSTQAGYLGKAKKPAPRRANFIPSTPNYFGYSWIDKDPDMEFIVGILGESGLSPEDVENETAALGHKVSRYTIIGWLYGSVRRPQNYTMTIVALACGWTKTWSEHGAGRATGKPETARAEAAPKVVPMMAPGSSLTPPRVRPHVAH